MSEFLRREISKRYRVTSTHETPLCPFAGHPLLLTHEVGLVPRTETAGQIEGVGVQVRSHGFKSIANLRSFSLSLVAVAVRSSCLRSREYGNGNDYGEGTSNEKSILGTRSTHVLRSNQLRTCSVENDTNFVCVDMVRFLRPHEWNCLLRDGASDWFGEGVR